MMNSSFALYVVVVKDPVAVVVFPQSLKAALLSEPLDSGC